MPKVKKPASEKDANSWKDAAALMRQAAAGAASQAAAFSKLAEFYEKPVTTVTPPTAKVGAKKRKQVKEEGQPKRAKSAYMLYVMDNIAQVRASLMAEKGEEFKQKDVMSELGEGWKTLGEDAKAPFLAKAAKAKEDYNAEVEAFKSAKSEAAGNGEATAASSTSSSSSSTHVEEAAAAAASDDSDSHRKKHKKEKKNKEKRKEKKEKVAIL